MSVKIKVGIREFIRNLSFRYQYFADLVEKHGEVFTLQIANTNLHCFLSPLHIKHVLVDNLDNYLKSAEHMGLLGDITKKYSLIVTNNKCTWKKDHDAANQVLIEDNIKKNTNIIVNITENHLANWKNYINRNEKINIGSELTSLTLKNLVKICLGNIDIDIDKIKNILATFMDLSDTYFIRKVEIFGIPLPGYFACKKSKNEMMKLGSELVDACLAANDDNIIKSIANSYQDKTISKVHLIVEALTFLVAGHDTTAAALSWACIYMSLYPEVQKQMHEEVITKIGDKNPTSVDLEKLTFIRAVFMESIRLQPPIPALIRIAKNTDAIGTFRINKGDIILIPIHHVHRTSNWNKPEGFDPSRFFNLPLQEYQYRYLPFGAGPRSCIGMHFSTYESIIILAMIVQRYQIHLKAGSEVTREPTVFNRPKSTLEMTVHSI